MRCVMLTKKGAPCRFTAAYDSLCLSHAASSGIQEALTVLKARGAKGGAKFAARADEAKATMEDCRMGSTARLVAVLEGELYQVKRSNTGDVVARAKAVTAIVMAAHSIIKTATIESENEELRKLIADHMPQLRKHLSVVK